MEKFSLFTKLPLELQHKILTNNIELLKKSQGISKTIKELTLREANRYRCKNKIRINELEKHFAENPKEFGLSIVDLNNERMILSANIFIQAESNKYQWIKRNVVMTINNNEIEIISHKDTEVMIENGGIMVNNCKVDIIESYRKKAIADIDIKTKYQILLRRGCDKEEAKGEIMKEIEEKYEGVNCHEINFGSLNLFQYLMYNILTFDSTIKIEKERSIEEILANNGAIYRKLRDYICEM